MTEVRRGRLPFSVRRFWWRVEARIGRWLPRLRARSAQRLVFVFDYDSTPLESAASSTTFRELSGEEIRSGRFKVGEAPTIPGEQDVESGCIVGMIGDQQVYHAWYIRSDSARIQDLPASWRASGPILFLHDGTTEPAFRHRGIHSAATRWLLQREKEGRVKHAVCVVHADNRAARRAVQRAGFRVVGQVR
jgi:RimJ/RimL family protein N-acetyltransferase